jgi:hypothetical protein
MRRKIKDRPTETGTDPLPSDIDRVPLIQCQQWMIRRRTASS